MRKKYILSTRNLEALVPVSLEWKTLSNGILRHEPRLRSSNKSISYVNRWAIHLPNT